MNWRNSHRELVLMKIVVIGATGNIGRRVAIEALSRGHEVVGVVRDPDAVEPPDPRVAPGEGRRHQGRGRRPGRAGRRRGRERHLAAPQRARAPRALPRRRTRAPSSPACATAGVKRVLYVGGASSLEVAPGKALADQPDFPEAYKAEAREGREALAVWRTEADGLDWTYLSPAAEIGPGERTGKYRTTGDQLLVDAAGKSFISFEDYAVAVLDELERPKHIGRRFGVAY